MREHEIQELCEKLSTVGELTVTLRVQVVFGPEAFGKGESNDCGLAEMIAEHLRLRRFGECYIGDVHWTEYAATKK